VFVIICNNCGVASEDSMRFCSECGGEVLSGSRSMASAQLRQPERDDRNVEAPIIPARYPAAETTRLADANTEGVKPNGRYAPVRVVSITIAIMLVVLFACAIVTWLILKGKDEPASRGAPETVTLTREASGSPSSVGVTPPISPAAPTNSSWEPEVTATLGSWLAALEAHDLDTHMSYFAETLDTYYSHRNVGAAKVRADLERAFSRYSTLSVRLSEIRLSFDRANESASVTLDKSWNFANGPETTVEKAWSGSVRQRVWLRRIGGRWRITGLKDI
jgi:SnoaL-like protein